MLTPPRRWPEWSGCYAEPLSWCGQLPTPRVPGRLDRCWRWASTWPPTRHATCYRTPLLSKDLRRSETNRPSLLRSAKQLLRRIDTPAADTALHGLRARVAELVWEANTGVDA
ncbi:MAG: hypothetical protein K0S98_1807 [Propionibacteriaceae bacterium]|nr:hypothetical protein [Propionibacteriaceae bacterium]